jgi:hypothetical protein
MALFTEIGNLRVGFVGVRIENFPNFLGGFFRILARPASGPFPCFLGGVVQS